MVVKTSLAVKINKSRVGGRNKDVDEQFLCFTISVGSWVDYPFYNIARKVYWVA